MTKKQSECPNAGAYPKCNNAEGCSTCEVFEEPKLIVQPEQFEELGFTLYNEHHFIKYGLPGTKRGWEWLDKTIRKRYCRKAVAVVCAWERMRKRK